VWTQSELVLFSRGERQYILFYCNENTGHKPRAGVSNKLVLPRNQKGSFQCYLQGNCFLRENVETTSQFGVPIFSERVLFDSLHLICLEVCF
jgi:hypothetical protein